MGIAFIQESEFFTDGSLIVYHEPKLLVSSFSELVCGVVCMQDAEKSPGKACLLPEEPHNKVTRRPSPSGHY
jgi:hypothetical protein